MGIKLKLELQIPGNDDKPRYTNEYINIDGGFGQNELAAVKDKYEVDGQIIHSWSLKEMLPYDEGYAAAMNGDDSDKNPYAEHFWKNNEWWLGWEAYHESD